ncbi:hypothetical protein [Roseomonas xinghualingensis]|uniref:hypothetical protein n=1 Tax=Roseomonas xinghualingensis TaxID=2986475 RepID=UPI0021F1AE19|nr:hypothetical protein [Roseomonas sp. SXEYE001]MCV4208116.1 hypothetical protein [Roseomonas sp. SXEYE001]
MNRPLVIAVPAALLGFGCWVWLTGPGTSVPNAILALVCGILCGRLGWWLGIRGGASKPRSASVAAKAKPYRDTDKME